MRGMGGTIRMAWREMYPAAVTSSGIKLLTPAGPEDTALHVALAEALPQGANLLTLGTGDDAELVRYEAVTDGWVTGCQRGMGETAAMAWEADTPVYRAYSTVDHQAFIDNIQALLGMIHPVGSIYMSALDQDPAALFGGEWARWGQGRVPVGVAEDDPDFAEAGVSGGAKAVEHAHGLTMEGGGSGTSGATALTLAQIPNAAGNVSVHGSATGSVLYSATGVFSGSSSLSGQYKTISPTAGASSLQNIYFNLGGGGGSHTHATPAHTHTGAIADAGVSTLQPYITCFMWKRIA